MYVLLYVHYENFRLLALYCENHVPEMVSDSQALEEMSFLQWFSHHCESTVKTFGPLRTYYPPLDMMVTFGDHVLAF